MAPRVVYHLQRMRQTHASRRGAVHSLRWRPVFTKDSPDARARQQVSIVNSTAGTTLGSGIINLNRSSTRGKLETVRMPQVKAGSNSLVFPKRASTLREAVSRCSRQYLRAAIPPCSRIYLGGSIFLVVSRCCPAGLLVVSFSLRGSFGLLWSQSTILVAVILVAMLVVGELLIISS